MKYVIALATMLMLAACAPINPAVKLAHAERNCRVESGVSKEYKVTTTGVGSQNVAYQACMARCGYVN